MNKGAEREQMDETGLMRDHRSSRAIKCEDYYINIIYTPNLGSEIAVSIGEREQSFPDESPLGNQPYSI